MRRKNLGWVAVWVFVLAVVLPSPTTAAERPSREEQKVLRVTTRLVQVNVVVQDRKGQPVTDLTRDDFVLTEEGRKEEISLFSKVTSEPTTAQAAPLPPNTFTNRLEGRAGGPKSVTMILLDALNTHFTDQIYAKAQIVKFLEQIQPDDRVGLYVLGSRPWVQHDFSGASRVRVIARNGESLTLGSVSVPLGSPIPH